MDVAEEYSAQDFLIAFRRFIAIRGAPKVMYSDKGTQLISASKELCKKDGITWSFNRPSDAPWYNGVCESLTKSLKRSLRITTGHSVLTFGELQTALFTVANLINERPIGIKPSFNLLLGRSSAHCPRGLFDINADHKMRLAFIHKVINSFRKKWQRDYFPTMIIRQKWHTVKRNVKVGDIVLVQDSNSVQGEWKLAQVIKADAGCDGFVTDDNQR